MLSTHHINISLSFCVNQDAVTVASTYFPRVRVIVKHQAGEVANAYFFPFIYTIQCQMSN